MVRRGRGTFSPCTMRQIVDAVKFRHHPHHPHHPTQMSVLRWTRFPIVGVIALVAGCNADKVGAPQTTTPTGRRLSVGEATVCALDIAGKVYCWGNNSVWWEYGVDSVTLARSGTPTP